MNGDSAANSQAHLSREQRVSFLFANMVIQQTNMALVFLGKVPHPESGETVRNLDAAQMFIDQLEMLEAKTKGNLEKQEEGLLRQSLTELRLAFVEAVREKSPPPAEKTPDLPNDAAPQPSPSAPAPEIATTDEERRKRFSKKY